MAIRSCLKTSLTQVGGGEIPVHNRPEAFQVFRTRIAVVDVVGVFPDITGQQRHVGRGQRRGGVAGVEDIKRSVRFLDQPWNRTSVGQGKSEAVRGELGG